MERCPEVVTAGPRGWSFQDLLELLLPLTAGAATHALEHLASLPSFAAAALCVFSLVEPSVISAGRPPPQLTQDSPALLARCKSLEMLIAS